ncbi:MAG TPA: hypothetical protein VGF94_07865 [Kofleriaceae bacterium]|jgi:hypothetical protein
MRTCVLLIVLAAACGGHATGGLGGGGGGGVDGGQPLPCDQANDTCPTGMYCLPDGTCDGLGCKDDTDCTGGQSCCDHACVDETSDPDNCGGCGIGCGSGDSCCTGACTMLNTLTDCGACGNACAAGDFCDGTQCNAPTYPNFCANNQVYVIYDDISADDHAADVMASTITANCPPTVMVTTASQTDAALVDQSTGQPLAGGGVTYVLGGGPFPSMPLRWLERTDEVTKIYFSAPDGVNFDWMNRTGDVVATMPGSGCTVHADQFISELVTDPMSGTLSLIGYGACSGGQGTLAAAWYYANVMLPNAALYPDSWYIVGWADSDNDSTPSAGDTYTILAHGL